MLRVLTLSSLYPDANRPNFGVFVERQTQGLAAADGVEVRVVAPVGVAPWPVSRLRQRERLALPVRETWRGVDVYRPRFTAIPGTAGRWHARMLVRALVPVLDAIRRDFPFDVIDTSFFFPDGPAAVMLGQRYGVPVSIKARGADIHLWGRSGPTAAQVREAGRGADGLLAVSGAMRDDMIALGMPGDRIRVHHTGIDTDAFRPVDRAAAKAALGVTGPLVLSLGALIPRKGHDIVLRAVATLPGVTLMIVGEGAERASLTALAASLGIADRVRIAGGVPHRALPAVIVAADVMALASRSEGLANAWIEALACGTPVVIPPIGGAAEVVTSADAGRIVARTPEAFAAAIRELIAAPPAPDAVSATVKCFTWQANTSALVEHLSALVAHRRERDQASSG
ncbi:glycosyltransferase [Sphingomonas sp. NIC1]|uniref:glycosyltransferase n=1 Tax=Sphingomonas sp. NIC1 TaxID=1961362 RepID=UPI0007C0F5E0|nr:glycosyltransferase [Sphingomonas sp. NIC1]ANC88056.1 glycoside hydrolase [Sphingomonas sp. NIC1]